MIETFKKTLSKIDGRDIKRYTIRFKKGIEVAVTNYGATITTVKSTNRVGEKEKVVLGFEDIEFYPKNTSFIGCTCGRYANRIAAGRFAMDGNEYHLFVNNNGNHLHGGEVGFDKVVWDELEFVQQKESATLRLGYLSTDMEEGYPGELRVEVNFTITSDAIQLDYHAETSKTTVINLTNHTYFNLTGNNEQHILDHQLQISAERYLLTDESQIPTGELADVRETDFDFLNSRRVGKRGFPTEVLQPTEGYDHCFALNNANDLTKRVAILSEADSGRKLEVFTTEPGIQLYTGNHLAKDAVGRFKQYTGICLETQHFPDSPNQSSFPGTRLEKGDLFHSTTIYKFGLLD